MVRDVLASQAGAGNGFQPSARSATRRRGQGAVAPDPDRHVPRLRVHADRRRGVAAALEAVLVGGPHPAHRFQRLVEQLVAPLEVDAERAVLAAQVPGRDREREPASGQHVDRRRRLRHDERVAVRQHDDVRDEPDPLGDRRDVGHRRERVERVVPAGVQPLVRRHRVVGERDAVEPGRFGGAGEAGQPLAGHELRVVGVGDERVGGPVLHGMSSDRGRRRIVVRDRTEAHVPAGAPFTSSGRPRCRGSRPQSARYALPAWCDRNGGSLEADGEHVVRHVAVGAPIADDVSVLAVEFHVVRAFADRGADLAHLVPLGRVADEMDRPIRSAHGIDSAAQPERGCAPERVGERVERAATPPRTLRVRSQSRQAANGSRIWGRRVDSSGDGRDAAPTATHATTPTAIAGVNRYGWTPPRISRPLTIAKRYPIGTEIARAVIPFWPARHEDTPSHVTMPRAARDQPPERIDGGDERERLRAEPRSRVVDVEGQCTGDRTQHLADAGLTPGGLGEEGRDVMHIARRGRELFPDRQHPAAKPDHHRDHRVTDGTPGSGTTRRTHEPRRCRDPARGKPVETCRDGSATRTTRRRRARSIATAGPEDHRSGQHPRRVPVRSVGRPRTDSTGLGTTRVRAATRPTRARSSRPHAATASADAIDEDHDQDHAHRVDEETHEHHCQATTLREYFVRGSGDVEEHRAGMIEPEPRVRTDETLRMHRLLDPELLDRIVEAGNEPVRGGRTAPRSGRREAPWRSSPGASRDASPSRRSATRAETGVRALRLRH